MDFEKINAFLHSEENTKGWEFQKKLAPPYRPKLTSFELEQKKPRKAAVLILLYKKNNQWHFPLMQRHNYNGHHSNQISFPGGKKEKFDIDFKETAKRETLEEIGIQINESQALKSLTKLYIPPSNFMVYPFFTIQNKELKFIPDPKEVKKILEIPLQECLDLEIQKFNNQKDNTPIPCFKWKDNIIWGATAMILNEWLESIKSLHLPL